MTGKGVECARSPRWRRAVARLLLVAGIAALVTSCGGDEPAATDRSGTGVSTASSASSSTRSSTTQPTSHTVEVDYAFGAPDLPYTIDPSAAGGLVLHGPAQYTGDWNAISNYQWASQMQGDRWGALSLGMLDGRVDGCGSGTFLLVVASVLPTLHANWLVVPGFGTGDLVALSGSGTWQTLEGDIRGAASSGRIRGTVTCNGQESILPEGRFFGTDDAGRVEVDSTIRQSSRTTAWNTTVDAGAAATQALSDGDLSARIEGTWTGTGAAHVAAATSPSAEGGYVEAAVMRVEGTFEGCGTGSVVVTMLDRVDATDIPGARSWEIVPGLGTGDLSGALGSGTGTTGTSGTIEGTMSCRG